MENGKTINNKRKFAIATIRQLKNNEWTFRWSRKAGSAPTATRKGKTLWCGNGAVMVDFSLILII